MRELLVESMALGVLGGVAGLALAFGGLRVLVALAPANLPRVDQIALDGWTLAFTALVSVVAGLVFGLIPAFKYAGPRVTLTLRAAGRSLTESRERHRARNTLVVVQVALALVLLVGAGLMIRTFNALRHVDPGFTHPESLQTFRLSIPDSVPPAAVTRLQQALMEKVATVPGVSSVALTSIVPMDEGGGWHDPIYAEDHVYAGGAHGAAAPLQDRVARPAGHDGQPDRRRPRLHLGRRVRHAAGRDGLREPGARAVERPGQRRRQADSPNPTRRGARSSASSPTNATTASARRRRRSPTGRCS